MCVCVSTGEEGLMLFFRKASRPQAPGLLKPLATEAELNIFKDGAFMALMRIVLRPLWTEILRRGKSLKNSRDKLFSRGRRACLELTDPVDSEQLKML